MFGRHLIGALGLGLAATAVAAPPATNLALEPCINGGVSASGNYASQALERRANGYLTWPNYAPYYLFAVSANYLESPFGEAPEAPLAPARDQTD